MQARLTRLSPQSLVATGMMMLAGIALVGIWLGPDARRAAEAAPQVWALALALAFAVPLGYWYPIATRVQAKIRLVTVPLYLLATLVPPPLAVLAGAAGILAGELVEHKARRSLPGESAAAVGRATIVVLLGATLAQTTTADGIARVTWLVATAVVMLAADVVTRAIALLAPERPFLVIVATTSDTVLIEGVQYLLGILGVLAALHHPSALLFLIFPIGIVYLAFKNVKESRDSTRALLESMADAVDLRDPYTGGHSRRVANLCRAILREMGISGSESGLILAAARVHDIGKIGVPDEILKKPGPLTPQERAIMNEHAERGALFLARYRDFAKGVTIVRYHHERWDGKGYPHGLKGVAIPFGARVIAVADCFDAMTSHRPYRRAMTSTEAVAILQADRGQQWDPVIVEAFIRYFARELDAPAAPGVETAVGRIESREPLETAV